MNGLRSTAHAVCATVLVTAIVLPIAIAQAPLTFLPPSLPQCVVDIACSARFEARGGAPRYQWRIRDGEPPPGMQLDARTGVLSGTPTSAGSFRFRVELLDSGSQRVERSLLLEVLPSLEIQWRTPPGVRDAGLAGSLRVVNHTGDVVTLTVIVVAVNEAGKAFSLGYQHFTVPANRTTVDIPFSMQQMPFGRYRVRADAVGEVEARKRIYRSNREAGPFTLP